MPSILNSNIDRPSLSLIKRQLILCIIEYGSSLSKKLAFVNLSGCCYFAHSGHGLDQLSHVC